MTAVNADVLRELRRRKRAQDSLHTYALSIDIPSVEFEAPCPDEDLLGPARFLMAKHHALILDAIQEAMDTHMGRLMLFLPPGSAKSLYASSVTPAWYLSKYPKRRVILTGYNEELVEMHARRCMQILEQDKNRNLWPGAPTLVRDAQGDFELSNESSMLAKGIKGGITGRRANLIIIDDPIKGREDADSEPIRQKIYNEYMDSIRTRLLPGASMVIIMTRWHEADLAGQILPDDYKGESGHIKCRDGRTWRVLNIPAKCERADDPLGRRLGEYLWTEYYPLEHWHMFEHAPGAEGARTWSSLYQQRPTPQGTGRFDESWIDYYKPGTQPPIMAYVGAGDYAVTEGGNDFTELGVFGVDTQGDLWEVDWWHEQCDTGKSCETTIDFIAKWGIPMWFNEGGVIDKAMGPLINLRMRQRSQAGERGVFADRRALPSMQDKVAKCSSFFGRASARTVHFRDNANSRRVVQQLVALPAGRWDDAADVCGLIGRAVDQFPVVHKPVEVKREILKPFTSKWVEHREEAEEPRVRYR